MLQTNVLGGSPSSFFKKKKTRWVRVRLCGLLIRNCHKIKEPLLTGAEVKRLLQMHKAPGRKNPSVFAHELKSFIAGQSAGITNFTKPPVVIRTVLSVHIHGCKNKIEVPVLIHR